MAVSTKQRDSDAVRYKVNQKRCILSISIGKAQASTAGDVQLKNTNQLTP